MSSIGILITSRNNYEFMDKFWLKRINSGKYPVLNIDEDSNKEEKSYGKKICKRDGVAYLDREKRGMLNNILTASKHFGDKCKFIVWFQTDCWPLQNNFFPEFEKLVDSDQLEPFGCVGFNGIADNIVERNRYNKMLNALKKKEIPIGIVARSPLETGDQWYSGVASRRIKKALSKPDEFRKPFSVEITAWFGTAVNVQKYKEHIDIEHPFEWFHCWDDICMQFLNKNIHNITLPHLCVDHRPDLKPEGGSPERAVRLAYKKDDTPLLVLAGKEYGTGSSRDWAAKGTALLGVRAVLAQSYERIHRSNLAGMGVLPLEYKEGKSAESWGLKGDEVFDLQGLEEEGLAPGSDVTVTAQSADGSIKQFAVTCRLDTPVEVDYFRNGGILQTVLRKLI